MSLIIKYNLTVNPLIKKKIKKKNKKLIPNLLNLRYQDFIICSGTVKKSKRLLFGIIYH